MMSLGGREEFCQILIYLVCSAKDYSFFLHQARRKIYIFLDRRYMRMITN